jgi:hypothetical protein
MRHQNKGIFNQNANLEWLLLAFETTRFGGGKTKKSSRHDPKSLWQFGSLVRPKQSTNMASELPHAPHAHKHTHACLQDQVIDKVAPPNTHTHTHKPQIFSSLRRMILRCLQAICLLRDGHPALVERLKCWTRGSGTHS